MSSQDPEPTGDAGAPTSVIPGLRPEPDEVPVAPRRSRRPVLLALSGVVAAGAVAAAVLYGTGTLPRSGSGSTGSTGATAAPHAAAPLPPVTAPTAAVTGLGRDGLLPWASPIALTVADGTLQSVTGTGPDDTVVTGAIAPDGSWTSTSPLVPSATYALVATVRDARGDGRTLPVQVSTTAPDKTFTATISPGDGAVVGTGQAVNLKLSAPITDPAARAALERKLVVTSTPAVTGSWRWMSSTTLRYRPEQPWPAHTTISVKAPYDHVQAATGAWGVGMRTTTFSTDDARTTVVDVAAHTATVSVNGQVVRTMKASMGIPSLPTRGGTFVVLEKFADITMDSSTVALPPGTAPYKEDVKDAVRITNSGTFLHGAPWSVGSQGRANVSHGCVNLSPADADWFYHQAVAGDLVTVVNSNAGPNLGDAGSQDWNLTFDQWRAGSALGS